MAHGYALVTAGRPLEFRDLGELTPKADEVVVQVAGCGICHTDVGFAVDGVPTRHPLPVVLGHEIAGRVIKGGRDAASLEGRAVVVPAVIPCGTCPACRAGRPTICRQQFMPGNDGDGGFATHVKLPSRDLCVVPEPLPASLPLAWLSVVADAITTPYEAAKRANLGAEHVAVFVGAGGVGGFGVQIASALGAAVVAVDVDDVRLALARAHGADLTLNPANTNLKEMKAAIRAFAKESGRTGIGLKVFETSGTPAGQQTAFGLLDFGGHLAVVGYTSAAVEIRLSNLMALDATAAGNWGCPPSRYPEVLELVLSGRVSLADYVETHPLSAAPDVFQAVVDHKLTRRAILVPEAIS